MSANKSIPRTQTEIKAIQEAGKLIRAAIAQLDLRGTDEQVSRAMSITHEVIHALTHGKHITPEKAYARAMRRLVSVRE